MKRNAEIRLDILYMAYQMERDAHMAVCDDMERAQESGSETDVMEFFPIAEQVVATAEVLSNFVFADEEEFFPDDMDFDEIIANEE